jgi:hypothetical protein
MALKKGAGEFKPCIIYLTEDERVLEKRLAARYLSGGDKNRDKYESRMARNAWERENLNSFSHLFYKIVKSESSPSLTADAVLSVFKDFLGK